jgi:hypothetical protein
METNEDTDHLYNTSIFQNKDLFDTIFFSILAFLNQYSRNEPDQFFLKSGLFSHVRPSDVTYEVVTPVHMTQLSSTLAGAVPRQSSCARAEGVTHEEVMPYDMAQLSHTISFGVTSMQNRTPTPLSLSSSSSLHLAATPLVICEFSPLIGA